MLRSYRQMVKNEEVMELSTDDVNAVYEEVVANPTADNGAIISAIAAIAKMNGVHLATIVKFATK